MSELRDLYQEVILDHSKQPRQFRALDDADVSADGFNPLCGDKLTVFLRTAGGRIDEATFQGSGCAISMASASMMAQAVRGATVAEIDTLCQTFLDLVTGKIDFDTASPRLGKLAVFAGVSKFPVRIKCALLGFEALQKALKESHAGEAL